MSTKPAKIRHIVRLHAITNHDIDIWQSGKRWTTKNGVVKQAKKRIATKGTRREAFSF